MVSLAKFKEVFKNVNERQAVEIARRGTGHSTELLTDKVVTTCKVSRGLHIYLSRVSIEGRSYSYEAGFHQYDKQGFDTVFVD